MKRLNLLPEELRPRRAAEPRVSRRAPLGSRLRQAPGLWYAVTVIGLLACVALGQGVALWRYRTGTGELRKELGQLQRLSAQMKTQQQALNVRRADLASVREQLEARRAALVSARQPPVPISTVLAELVQALPTEVWITKLSFTGELLKIIGATTDAQSVANLMSKLDEAQRFSETRFTYTQRANDTEEAPFTFEISTRPVLHEPSVRGGSAPDDKA